MKRRTAFSIVGSIAAVIFSVGSALAAPAQKIPGEYLVKYRGNAIFSVAGLNSIAQVRVLDNNPTAQLAKVKITANEVKTLARLFADSNVEYVVPNVRIQALAAPFDAQALKEQWALKKVNAEGAWAKAGKGSRSVVVAIIDTGMDSNHESLKLNAVPGYDFKENDADPYDKTGQANPGHGTHCAGIIGATGLVDGGVIGMSPLVSMMPIRFLGEDGSGDLNAAIKAIDYAIEKKADVISASWGATIGRSQAQPLVDAVKRADDAGVIFVAAAANDGKSNDVTEVYPANSGFANTITVAASGSADEKPSWSNYGRRTVHLASPGLTIMSTLPGNKYDNLSGTSMATPLVSGMVALLLSQDPSLTGAQARALLQTTGAQVQIETACDCRVDASAAVNTLMSKKLFIAPAAGTLAVGETMKFSGVNGSGGYEYSSSNAGVGSIAADGTFTATALGETTVSVKDSSGTVATSLKVTVAEKPTGGGGACPLGDQAMCDMLCQIMPQLPFCNQ
ncbi:MAG TPA: S8 family serine peptidase [Bdellovibrionales bacterium]|nr:S8 family serine peptidase [Bdellovibrionales bacterium]